MNNQPSHDEIVRMQHTLVDHTRSVSDRVQAANLLSTSTEEASWSALQEVAERVDENPDVLRAAGRGLGAVYVRLGRVLDAPLANLSPDAYLAFDEYVAGEQER
jgi:hypothetical protein